ncbi:MAG: vWA domain-containing protein [Planctomycetota bacterium]|jgi:hypothetical protein
MTIKTHCTGCRKLISIDAAFAGSVCRCPYCKAINNVPHQKGDGLAGMGPRPDAPTVEAADAAQHAGVRPAGAGGPAAAGADIPMANRVPVQGIVGIVLILAMIGLVVAAVVIVIQAVGLNGDGKPTNGGPTNGPASLPENPFLTAGQPAVAGNIAITAPVIYIVDASGSMEGIIGYVGEMVAASMRSLPAGARASVLVVGEDDTVAPADDYVAMPGGASAVTQIIEQAVPFGATELAPAIDRALALKPTTIVLFAAKYVEDDTYTAATRAGQQGVPIMTVAPTGHADIADDLAELSRRSGGKSRHILKGQLQQWLGEAMP